VLHLPTIVEAAESSPAAAKECAQVIRKFLSKDNFSRPHVQYNGIMLVRILSDNPGPTFTRNLDKKFAETVKELLRLGRDPSVKQILIETLDNFQREKKDDENLAPLIQMWEKEQAKMEKAYGPKVKDLVFRYLHFCSANSSKGSHAPPRALNSPPLDNHNQNYFSRSHSTNRPLPPPHELSSRIEEARTSAKLLTQLVQSTPPTEFDENDLIREFAERCLSASRSIQGYISSQNPAPDDDTMLTLIDTNDQLALAMSKHQRGILQARKALGLNTENGPSSGNHSPNPDTGYTPPPGPPPSFTKPTMPPRKPGPAPAPPSTEDGNIRPERRSRSPNPYATEKPEDPFKDPAGNTMQNAPFPIDQQPPTDQFFDRLGVEPYHPGFKPTQSYMGRQDSAVGKMAMHAAGPAIPEIESEKEVVEQNHISEEDSYGVSPVQRKAPIYRY
jgi:hypothetical protein